MPLVVSTAIVLGSQGGEPAGTFPLEVSGRHLVTAAGDPFPVMADTVWLAPTLCTQAQVAAIVADRKAKGFNALAMSLLGGVGSDNTQVTNAYGVNPFTGGSGTWDLADPIQTGAATTDDGDPDYDYWDHVAWIVDHLAANDMVAVLVPSWYGRGGRDWQGYVTNANATTYGTFLAGLLGDRDNVLWMLGGDNDPDDVGNVPGGLDTSNKTTATNNMAAALLAGSSVTPLMTYHAARSSTARTWFGAQSWYTMTAAYPDKTTHDETLTEWDNATEPVFMVEAYYDARSSTPILTRAELRAELAWAYTCGACVVGYGHEGIWDLSGYPADLDAVSSDDAGRIGGIFGALPALIPDHRSGNSTKMLTSGYGTASSTSWATSGVAADGTAGACYFPNSRGSIVVNLAAFTGTVALSWVNPETGAETAVGTFAASGTQAVTYPSGWADALLIAEQGG